jgi:hypothetical protein
LASTLVDDAWVALDRYYALASTAMTVMEVARPEIADDRLKSIEALKTRGDKALGMVFSTVLDD